MTPDERRHLFHSLLIDAILLIMLWERREQIRVLARAAKWHVILRTTSWRAEAAPAADEFYCCEYAEQR